SSISAACSAAGSSASTRSSTRAYASPSASRTTGMQASGRTPAAARSDRTITATEYGSAGTPGPALAARLLQQPHVFDYDALVDRLAHVVNGQCGDAGGDHRLHFDPGLRAGRRSRVDLQHLVALPIEADCDLVERQRVAKRNKLAGSLGRE